MRGLQYDTVTQTGLTPIVVCIDMISLAPLLDCSRLAAVQTQHNMDLWLANVSTLHARVKLHHQVYWREQVSARLIRCCTELNSANN